MATIQEIIALADVTEIVKILRVTYPGIKTKYETCEKQYDQSKHDIFDETIRPKKAVRKPTGEKDSKGNDEVVTSHVDVARIAVPFQKIIVNRTASFLLNEGVMIRSDVDTGVKSNEGNLVQLIEKIWSDNKLNYKTKQLARMLMAECEVAEIWYFVEEMNFWQKFLSLIGLTSIKFKARVKIVANSMADKLFPHFDEAGDMDAFSREYAVIEGDKTVTKFEVYTAEKIIHYTLRESIWSVDEGYPQANLIGKIPVIYYWQAYPEWNEVQQLIDRYETLLSNFADANDYFGSPMVKVTGEVTGFAEKGEQGKVIQLSQGADAEYMTWEQAPESIKIEIETLQNLIYSMVQVPDISFSQMSKLGPMSGVSRKLMFLDMHLKCFNKIEVFGEMMQRRLNLLKAMVGKVIATKYSNEAENVELWPEFVPYLPSSEEDLITSLVTAAGGKPIISQKTAVKLNPYVTDPEAEIEEIKSEEMASNAEPMI